MHIGVCCRDLPLRPACCRNPLVSRSRQVMSFLFWGGSMVANVSDWERCKKFIAHVFLVFFSADEEKKHVYALEYFVDVWFFSLLRFGASLMCNFCRRLISLRNYLLRLMSAQLLILWQHLRRVMSLRNYCYAWCLRNWCLWQHQHLSTLLQGKYRVIAETCQMTMNYMFFLRWASLFSTKKNYDFNDQSGPYWDRKTWTLIEGTR